MDSGFSAWRRWLALGIAAVGLAMIAVVRFSHSTPADRVTLSQVPERAAVPAKDGARAPTAGSLAIDLLVLSDAISRVGETGGLPVLKPHAPVIARELMDTLDSYRAGTDDALHQYFEQRQLKKPPLLLKPELRSVLLRALDTVRACEFSTPVEIRSAMQGARAAVGADGGTVDCVSRPDRIPSVPDPVQLKGAVIEVLVSARRLRTQDGTEFDGRLGIWLIMTDGRWQVVRICIYGRPATGAIIMPVF